MQRELLGRQCSGARTQVCAVRGVAWALLLMGCSPSDPAGVLVTVTSDGRAARPDHVIFSWADDRAILIRDVRVPQQGALATAGDVLASVFIEADPRDVAGRRVAVARGIAAGTIVSSGAIAFRRLPGTRQDVTLLLRAGEPRDRDRDGVPDEVDSCPDVGTSQFYCPENSVVDAGPGIVPADAAIRPADAATRPADAAAVVLDGGAPVVDALSFGEARPPLASRAVLMVVASTTPEVPDALLRDRLVALGLAPTLVLDSDVAAAQVDDKGLVLISPTVTGNRIGTRFRDVPVPVVCFESYLFDDMGMTGGAVGEVGREDQAWDLEIVNGSHALAAGLQGIVRVFEGRELLGWGMPGPTATRVATVVSVPERVTIFAYEAGATMPGATAPARRVGLFGTNRPRLRAPGGALFDAAVKWAMGR